MPKKIVDTYIVYQIIKRLSTPFEETDAFKLGLIDDSGNILKKRREMSREEKEVMSHFDIMIFNLKRYLAKLPGGDSKFRNFATALFLLKEDVDFCLADTADVIHLAEEIVSEKDFQELKEDIANSIGGGSMDNTVKPAPLKTSKFGKCQVYHVSSDTFSKCRHAKGRYERFMKVVGEGPVHDSIRDYAKSNPGKSIMLHDEKLGAYTVLKMGSKERW